MKKVFGIVLLVFVITMLMACSTNRHVHDFSQQVESIEYLKSPGTCIDYEVYYYSCSCGAKGKETFEGGSKGDHDFKHINVGEVGHVEYDECCYCHKKKYSELPRIDIVTNGAQISEDYIDANISVSRCDEKYGLDNVKAAIKVRGNGSAEYDKKPFRIKFYEKQVMLGLNDDLMAKNWVLINEYNDRSRMRNFSAYFISNYLFNHDGYYSTDMMFVEVYINGKYNGLYLLCEQQQINDSRVDINKVKDEYTGVDIGYFFELDTYYYNEKEIETFAIDYKYGLKYRNGHTCPKSKFQNHYTIKSDIYSVEQNEFIKEVVENIFFIIYDALNGKHNNGYYTLDKSYNLIKDTSIKTSKEAIERVLDLRSYVDMFIIQDLAQNVDIGWSSFYFAFDASSSGEHKLILEAPWDFDWAMGSSFAFKEGLFCVDEDESGRDTTLADYVNPWMLLFANTDWFYDLVKARWQELKQTNAFNDLYEAIDILTNKYASNFTSEFALWPKSMTKVLDRSKGIPEYLNNTTHYTSAMYFKEYIKQKEEYYDSLWLK